MQNMQQFPKGQIRLPDLGPKHRLSHHWDDNYHIAEGTTAPHASIPKQWLAPVTESLAGKKHAMPSVSSIVGNLVICSLCIYGFIEIAILLGKAFQQAIR